MKFNYLMSKQTDNTYEHHVDLESFVFNYDNDKLLTKVQNVKNSLIVYGKVIDSRDSKLTAEKIALNLLEATDSQQLIELAKYLAGRFLIVYKNNGHIMILPDATCSVPVFYTVTGYESLVSSNQTTIAKVLNLDMSVKALRIKDKAEEQQPLPYDITMYDELKVVIPNHILDVNKQDTIRYFPLAKIIEKTVEEVVQETIALTKNVVDNYMADSDLIIPLTAGKDSRLILSFFKDYKDRISLYTFDHQQAETEPDDIRIPKKLTGDLGLSYQVFSREKLDEQSYGEFTSHFSGTQNRRILENALTLKKSELEGKPFVTGDIIPIVKSNFGKKLPERLANTAYLVTKTHNYSKENKEMTHQWLTDVKEQAHENDVSLFDLFFWEMRLGRWLPNNMSNYDTMSDPVLIFNNRQLLESWIAIPRDKRVDTNFHERIIEELWPELLETPLTSGKGLINDLTENSYMYYLATFFKYGIKKFKN